MKPYMFQFPQLCSRWENTPFIRTGSAFLWKFLFGLQTTNEFYDFFHVVLRRKYSHLVLSKINTSGHVLGCSACGSTSHLFKFLHVPSR